MTAEQRAAFINAQTAMMRVEQALMEAQNIDRERQCLSPKNGPGQWQDFFEKWECVLGYNALIAFFRDP